MRPRRRASRSPSRKSPSGPRIAKSSGMKKLAEKNRTKVIDLLSERLAFERAGVKLYDSILAKMESSAEEEVAAMIDQMREHRDQEWRHEEFLEEKIRE